MVKNSKGRDSSYFSEVGVYEVKNYISKPLKEFRGDSLNDFLAITSTVIVSDIRLLQLPSLETRRLQNDLIWCYKIVFGHTITHSDFFEFRLSNTLPSL